jgi:hypothetical protein
MFPLNIVQDPLFSVNILYLTFLEKSRKLIMIFKIGDIEL